MFFHGSQYGLHIFRNRIPFFMSLFFDNTDKVVAVANTTTAREAFFLLLLYILTLLLLLFNFDCIVDVDSLYRD